MSEFLANVPRRGDDKRSWPPKLKASSIAKSLIEGETVKAFAKRYDLFSSTMPDWRRMARQGKLVLFDLVAWILCLLRSRCLRLWPNFCPSLLEHD